MLVAIETKTAEDTARAYRRQWSLVAGRAGKLMLPVVGFVIVGLVWEFVARVIVANPLLFSPLSSTLQALWDMFKTGSIWTHLSASGQEFAMGYVIAAAGGVLIGAVLAALPVASNTFAGVIQAAYATPLIALAPLLVVLFGIGLESKVIVVFLLAVFPVIIATESAFRTVNPEYVETARAFGAGRLQVVAKVVFPAAAVGVLTGLRLGVGRGIIGVVVGEIFGAQRGLGFLIVQYSEAFRTADVLAVVLLLAAIGVGTNSALRKLEDRLSPWTRSAGPRRTA